MVSEDSPAQMLPTPPPAEHPHPRVSWAALRHAGGAGADAGAEFTLWAELRGNATAEAVAAGTPVVRLRADHNPMSLAPSLFGGNSGDDAEEEEDDDEGDAYTLAAVAVGRAGAAPFGTASRPQSLSAVATARWGDAGVGGA